MIAGDESATPSGAVSPAVARTARRSWTDAELLAIMQANAPAGVQPAELLPMLRGLVANGADPRSIVAAVGGQLVAADEAASPARPPQAAPPSAAEGALRVATRRWLRVALVVGLWLLAWELADLLVGNRLILAGPVRTAQALVEQAADPAFWITVAASFGRISLGFVAAVLCGIALALLGHRWWGFHELLGPPMAVLKSVPMVSIIIMLLIWVGNQALTVWLAFLIVVPLVFINMSAGLAAVDPHATELARVYRLGPWKRFWYFSRPAFLPFLVSACQVGLGMSWKAGIMAEVFATPALSIGKELFTAKTFLDTPAVFAWTVVVMLASLAFERVVLRFLRWCSRPFGGVLGGR